MLHSPHSDRSSRLEISLLGGFSVLIDGQILPEAAIQGKKARTLLKTLAHQRRFQMVKEHAADALWPGLDTVAAASQLYKAIHHIRKAFSERAEGGSDWITLTDDLVRLNPPGGVATDAQRFEQVARSGLQNRNIADLEMAVSIYSGDFLPMDRYAEWASLPREHYRQLYIDALCTLAIQYERKGDLTEAAEMLRLALEKEPTLEAAHQGLMRIFALKGQSTRAFHQYDLCREILREELGMTPSSGAKQLLDDIAEGKIQKKDGQAPMRSTVPAPVARIFGRKKECAALRRLVDKLSAGEGGLLIISGDMGTGKTRLTEELALYCRENDVPFYLTRTNEEPSAYGAFIEFFEDALRDRPELESELPLEIRRLMPGSAEAGLPIPHADQLAARAYLFARIHQFISKLSGGRPLAMIFEDLHEADRESLELLAYLMQRTRKLPALVTLTTRKEPNKAISQQLNSIMKAGEVMETGPLAPESHAALIHHYAALSGTDIDNTDRLYALTEGNPLFAIELLKYYADEGEVTEIGRDTAPAPKVKIPPSLLAAVEYPMRNLEPAARQLLYIAAVIGRKVPYELMTRVWSGEDRGDEQLLFDALEELIRARLLIEKGLNYSFRHTLVREAIYIGISEARRRTLHRLVADKLADATGAGDDRPLEAIAHHFLQAGDISRAVEYLSLAGKRAERAYAHETALQCYREACLALDSSSDRSPQKIKILERMGDVYRACGRIESSYEAYLEAIGYAEQIQAGGSGLAELHRKMSVAAILRSDIERSERHLSLAFKLADRGDPGIQARLLITRALHLWHLNQLEEGYKLAKEALEMAEEIDAVEEAAQACEILAMTCLPLGRWEEGLKYEMQRKLYGWSPEIVVATDAHLCLWEYHVSGDRPLQQARGFIEQVAGQAEEIGDLRCVAVCHYALGTMYLWRGQREQAVNELSSSLHLHEQVGSPAGMAYALARKGALHTLMGATDLGWASLQEGLRHAQNASVRDHCLQRLYGVGIWNRMEAGDMKGARGLAAEGNRLLEEEGACAACALELYPWLAYFYLNTGDIDRARNCGEMVSSLAAKTGNPIGKAMAAIIASSLCVAENDEETADERCRESFDILKNAVAEASHSPVAHFLERMVAQQDALRMT